MWLLAELYVRQFRSHCVEDGPLLQHGWYVNVFSLILDAFDRTDDACSSGAEEFEKLF